MSIFLNVIFAWQSILFYNTNVKANYSIQGMHSFFNYFSAFINWCYSVYRVSTHCNPQGTFLSIAHRQLSRRQNTRLDAGWVMHERTTTIHSTGVQQYWCLLVQRSSKAMHPILNTCTTGNRNNNYCYLDSLPTKRKEKNSSPTIPPSPVYWLTKIFNLEKINLHFRAV